MKKQKENTSQVRNSAVNQTTKKQGRPLKEVVPSNNTKYLRENVPINIPNTKISEGRDYYPYAQPFEIFPEWNEEEAQALSRECISNQLLNQNSNILLSNTSITDVLEYSDSYHSEIEKNLPHSLLHYCNYNVRWLRPREYVKNFLLDKEIKMSYPKKNYVRMRVDIKDTYDIFKRALASENEDYELNIDTLLADDEESRKKNIYKEFYRIIDRPLELRVVDSKDRQETDEEYKNRRDLEILERNRQEAMIKSSKKVKLVDSKKTAITGHKVINEKNLANNNPQLQSIIGYNEERLTIKVACPSNITISESFRDPIKVMSNSNIPTKMMFYNFGKWVGSILQTILDLNIYDAYTNKPIWYNIYPQKDNIPIYNPSGKYMIKLYLMGKPRKIEIDDRIPCNQDDEYILPMSASIEELWPALFTKALIKLNMYKMKYPNYVTDEIGDCSIIYNLTGYIGQTVDLENQAEEDIKFLKSLQEMLSDEIYCEKKKFLISYKKSSPPKEEENGNDERLSCGEEGDQNKLLIKRSIKAGSNKADRRKSVRQLTNILFDEKFDRSSQRRLSYNNVFLKNMFHVGVQSSNRRASALNVYNSNIFNKAGNKDQDEPTLLNLPSLQDFQPLTTGNSNLYFDFAYSISDFFDNENFNMNRLNQLDFSDLKQQLKDFQVSIVYKQLNKEDKKKYITSLIELKNKQKEEKIKRLEDLKKEGKKFNLVKIMNESLGNNTLNFYIPYTQEEILMVKKCLLNNWDFPPPSYFDDKYKGVYRPNIIKENNHKKSIDNKNTENNLFTLPNSSSPGNKTTSKFLNREYLPKTKENIIDHNHVTRSTKDRKNLSDSMFGISEEHSTEQKNQGGNGQFYWNKESYMQLIDHNIEQFDYEKDPVIRQNGGVWIYYPEFKSYFNRFIILHNPNKIYKGQIISENPWNDWQNDLFEPNEENEVFVLNKNEHYNIFDNDSSMLILFQPNSEKTFNHYEKIKSYVCFDIIDSDQNVIHNELIMKSFFCTFHSTSLKTNKDYFIITKGASVPFGYFLQIFAESHSVSRMSHNTYLKKKHGFQSFFSKIDHPTLDKNKLYILFRFSVKTPNNFKDLLSVKFYIKYPDKYSKRYFKLVCYENTMTNKKVFNFNEMIKLKQDGNIYYFVLSVNPAFILGENSLEFECLYDNKDVKIEQYDHIEGYEICDKFTPNKQNILFKEFVYSPDIVHTSFEIKIHESKIIPQVQQELSLPVVNPNRLNSSRDQRRKSVVYNQNTEIRPIYKSMQDKIRLKVVLYKLQSLNTITPNFDLPKQFICQWDFYNEAVIHHLTLEGVPFIEKPPENKKVVHKEIVLNLANSNATRNNSVSQHMNPMPYLLVCYIDPTEMPEYMKDLSGNQMKLKNIDVHWTIGVFSTDTLGFVKDTTKEDSEKILKESWENQEQGRCEKSRKSRKRFLIQTKKEKGSVLSQEEQNLLNEVRERKISTAPPIEETKVPIINNLKNKNNKTATNKKIEILKQKNNLPTPFPSSLQSPIVVEEVKKVEPVKTLPIPDKHVSEYIRNFLFYSYNERTLVFDNKLNQKNIDIKLKEEKANKILKENEEYEKYRQSEISNYNSNKTESTDIIKSFYRSSYSFRKENKEDTTPLIRARDHLKNEFHNKYEIEKAIRELITNSAAHFEFNHAMTLFKEYPTHINYNEDLISQLHQFISLKKEELLRAEIKRFSVKDKNNIIKHLEDIENNKLKINSDVLHKLKELIK